MSEYYWDTVDDAIEEGLKSLDPEADDYLQRLQALSNLIAKRNDASKDSTDCARLKMTEELAKKRNRIEIFKIGAGIFGGIVAAAVGVWEFIKTMNFETDGGFFRSSSGKQIAREKRKEKEKDTYFK